MNNRLGLLLAFGTLIFWSLSPFFFAGTGRRIGPFATNLLRLAFALTLLVLFILLGNLTGTVTSVLPDTISWIWLGASGAVGLALGDFFLYRALVDTGPERTSQILTLAPAATAALAWIALREVLSPPQLGGMALILSGVSLATWSAARKARAPRATSRLSPGAIADSNAERDGRHAAGPKSGGKPARYLVSGAWAAVWAALCQGLGTVLARHAFLMRADLDPVLATTIRVAAGTAALWGFARLRGPIGPVLFGWRNPKVLKLMAGGVLAGPVFGMLCYVGALKYAPAGVVTTITFMGPLLIIPMGAWHYGTRISVTAVMGTAISLVGVAFLGLG